MSQYETKLQHKRAQSNVNDKIDTFQFGNIEYHESLRLHQSERFRYIRFTLFLNETQDIFQEPVKQLADYTVYFMNLLPRLSAILSCRVTTFFFRASSRIEGDAF